MDRFTPPSAASDRRDWDAALRQDQRTAIEDAEGTLAELRDDFGCYVVRPDHDALTSDDVGETQAMAAWLREMHAEFVRKFGPRPALARRAA